MGTVEKVMGGLLILTGFLFLFADPWFGYRLVHACLRCDVEM